MLQNSEGGDYDHEPVEEDDRVNGDEDSDGNRVNNNDRKIRNRTIITPLDMNILTNRVLPSTTHISISRMMQDPKLMHHKNYINIMLLCVISNKS